MATPVITWTPETLATFDTSESILQKLNQVAWAAGGGIIGGGGGAGGRITEEGEGRITEDGQGRVVD